MENRRKMIEIGMTKVMPIFDTNAWIAMDEAFGSLDEALSALQKPKGWAKATAKCVAILCERALEESGEKPIGEKAVGKMIPPKKMQLARIACLEAIAEGSRMEYPIETDGKEDLVLKEIEKKENPGA